MTLCHLVKGKSITYSAVVTLDGAMDGDAWEQKAKGLLRSEMTRRSVTYEQLIDKLSEIGVKEDHRNLRNKVARGKFSAALFLQCLEALGAKELRLD